jgi:hypothetical protein
MGSNQEPFFQKTKVPDNTIETSPLGVWVLRTTNFELQTHLDH